MSEDPRIALYKKLSEHTQPVCATYCRKPQSCCDAYFCEAAIVYAKEHWNTTLERTGHPTLPMMGPNGCIVEPHMRPLCTYHVCCVDALGYKPNDPAWTLEYFNLREMVQNAEWKHEGHKPTKKQIQERIEVRRDGMAFAKEPHCVAIPKYKVEEHQHHFNTAIDCLTVGITFAADVVHKVTEEIQHLRKTEG